MIDLFIKKYCKNKKSKSHRKRKEMDVSTEAHKKLKSNRKRKGMDVFTEAHMRIS